MRARGQRKGLLERAALVLIILWGVGCGKVWQESGPAPQGSEIPSSPVQVGDGLVYRTITAGACRVWLLEADLTRPGVRLTVATRDIRQSESPRAGLAQTVAEWCAQSGAAGGVNGGFFGETHGDRKEFVGLLIRDYVVHSGWRHRRPDGRIYARATFVVDNEGAPSIHWAAALRDGPPHVTLFRHPEAAEPVGHRRACYAVGCGPMLVQDGLLCVTDREERLVSRGRRPRTFVALANRAGRPVRAVLGVAQAMEYRELAAFLVQYGRDNLGLPCSSAMCLDGGTSSQLAYRDGDRYATPAPAWTTVPSAVLVFAEQQDSGAPHR